MQKTKHIIKDCSVIILAAGRSRRMGIPKFALRFDNKKNFLEAIIEQYLLFGCKDIIVVLNKTGIEYYKKNPIKYAKNIVFIENFNVDRGRFYSIKTGIKHINVFPVFIHNVDNPFVSQEVLQKLLSISGNEFIAPYFKGQGGHPVLLSSKIGIDILKERDDDIILYDFLKRYKKTKVKVSDDVILININTVEEYNRYFSGC